MLLEVLVFVVFFLGIALLVMRSLVIARIQERGLDVGLGKYSSFNFSDNLAWRLIRKKAVNSSDRERRLFLAFFIVWVLFYIFLAVSLVELLSQ
jgi:hypothetical protein